MLSKAILPYTGPEIQLRKIMTIDVKYFLRNRFENSSSGKKKQFFQKKTHVFKEKPNTRDQACVTA